MLRSLSVSHDAALDGRITQPRNLVQIGFASPVQLSSGATLNWNGLLWLTSKMTVSLDMSGAGGSLSIWDYSAALRTLLVLEGAVDKAVRVWQFEGDTIGVEPPALMFDGVIRSCRIARGRCDMDLAVSSSGALQTPRERICRATGFSVVAEAGTLIHWGNKTLKLVRRN